MLSNFGTWVFLCICMWVCGVSSLPVRPQSEARLAVVDDVTVLMYGVLQFSESLHHMYQNTETKLVRITRAISHTESLVQRLGQDTEQAASFERRIKERLGVIQAQTTALRVQAQQTRGVVNEVEQEEVELKQKLTNLEANLSSFTSDKTKALKKHRTLLNDLVGWTEKQKQQLKNQNQQLAELQKQTSRNA